MNDLLLLYISYNYNWIKNIMKQISFKILKYRILNNDRTFLNPSDCRVNFTASDGYNAIVFKLFLYCKNRY